MLGSDHFVKQAAAVKQAKAYVNFDMVGRLRHGRLIVQGAGSSADWRPLLETACIREPLALNIQDDPYLPTDSTPFYIAGVPVLAFFTDVHEDYNRPTDDADTLNYAGMEQITRFAQHVVSDLAERDTPLSYVEVGTLRPARRRWRTPTLHRHDPRLLRQRGCGHESRRSQSGQPRRRCRRESPATSSSVSPARKSAGCRTTPTCSAW